MSAPRTYLDHNATSPLRPEARAAMIAALDVAGNPSSVHAEGRQAKAIIEAAREEVAALVGAKPAEVTFTSGATEANNWIVRGGCWSGISYAATSHLSVIGAATSGSVPWVAIGWGTAPATETIAGGLVSFDLANNETGIVTDPAGFAEARAAGAAIHADAVQAAGKLPLGFAAAGLDALSLSAHKFGGPAGVGALVVSDACAPLRPLLAGGGQERRRRAGTENVAAIAGFGAAARSARLDLAHANRLRALRDRLEAGVRAITPSAIIIGAAPGAQPASDDRVVLPRLPNTSCIALPGVTAETTVIRLDLAGIAVSSGSACSSGKVGKSHVLAAMGLGDLAGSAIRVSLGWTTTEDDIARFVSAWNMIHGAGALRSVA